jgi:hypothetical protein
MPGYADALFMQTEQLRFLRTAAGVRYMAAFDSSMREQEYEGDRYAELPEGLSWQLAHEIVTQADPIYVSPHMVDMLEYAYPSFEPEPVLPTDLFAAAGFAYLPRPVWIADVHEDRLPIRAVGWVPVRGQTSDTMDRGGVWVMFWSHREDERDVIAHKQQTGEPMVQEQQLLEAIMGLPHGVMHVLHSFWMPYNATAWENVPDARYRDVAHKQWALAQTLWRLGSQVVRTVERPHRQARREAKRHGVENDHVTVIQLRKTSSMVSGGTVDVDEMDREQHYSVQFVVRGHWRNQWYPSKGEHRQVWINPHVKGPEDAPFQPSKRVFELVR